MTNIHEQKLDAKTDCKKRKDKKKNKKRKRSETADDAGDAAALVESRKVADPISDDVTLLSKEKKLKKYKSGQEKKKSKKKKKHKKDQKDEDGSDEGSHSENKEAIMQRHQEAERKALVGHEEIMKEDILGKAVVESSAIEYYDPDVIQAATSLTDNKNVEGNSTHSENVNNPVLTAKKHDYSLTLLLFYQYVEPVWDDSTYEFMLKTLQKVGIDLELTGRMRVAREGLNCTLTASHSAILEYCNTLRRLRPTDFENTEFKLTRDLPVAQKFPNLKVFKVVELVHYGLEGAKAPPITKYHGTHLEPKEYHKKLAEPNTVIIDVVSGVVMHDDISRIASFILFELDSFCLFFLFCIL